MNKQITTYLMAGLGFVVCLVVVVWLVRSEGERTRATIHEAIVEAGCSQLSDGNRETQS